MPASAPGIKRWGRDYFPNVALVDQDGRKLRLYDDLLQGKAVVINTFFAGCSDVCPLSTAKMLELQRLLGDRVGRDVHFYSISVDPLHDTPGTMKAYAERFGVGPGWRFLSGAEEDVQAVVRKLGLGSLYATGARERHSTTLTIGREPTGQWMRQSSVDNPSFVAAEIATFLGWKVSASQPDYRTARPMNVSNGRFLFQNGCAACHTIGGGEKIGPDLRNVQERWTPERLERFILLPDEMFRVDAQAQALLKAYRGVRMPNLGLARDEVADILAHIAEVSAQGNGRAPASIGP